MLPSYSTPPPPPVQVKSVPAWCTRHTCGSSSAAWQRLPCTPAAGPASGRPGVLASPVSPAPAFTTAVRSLRVRASLLQADCAFVFSCLSGYSISITFLYNTPGYLRQLGVTSLSTSTPPWCEGSTPAGSASTFCTDSPSTAFMSFILRHTLYYFSDRRCFPGFVFRSIPFFVFLVLLALVIVGVYRVSRIAIRQFPCLISSAPSGLSVQIKSGVRRRGAGNMFIFFWRWKRNLVSFSSAVAFFQI